MLDFLASDGKSSAILLHLEHLSDARWFLSSARGAERLLNYFPGLDATYDAAIQRAGLVRVRDTHELFSAVEILSHIRPLGGERLMIISNGIVVPGRWTSFFAVTAGWRSWTKSSWRRWHAHSPRR